MNYLNCLSCWKKTKLKITNSYRVALLLKLCLTLQQLEDQIYSLYFQVEQHCLKVPTENSTS